MLDTAYESARVAMHHTRVVEDCNLTDVDNSERYLLIVSFVRIAAIIKEDTSMPYSATNSARYVTFLPLPHKNASSAFAIYPAPPRQIMQQRICCSGTRGSHSSWVRGEVSKALWD